MFTYSCVPFNPLYNSCAVVLLVLYHGWGRQGPEQTWPGPAPHSLTGARHCDLTLSASPASFPVRSPLALFLPAIWNCLYFLPHAKHLPDSGPAFLEALLPLPASSLLLLPSPTQPSTDWWMLVKQLIRHPHGAVPGSTGLGLTGEGTDLGIITFAEASLPFPSYSKDFSVAPPRLLK